jgi:hypothetical protein
VSLDWVTWTLIGVFLLSGALVTWAVLTGDPASLSTDPVPKHAHWTTEGATTRLGPKPEPVAPMERDGGVAQPLKVRFCAWCPVPAKPEKDFHPLGQRVHLE